MPTVPLDVDQFVFEIGIDQRPPILVDQFVFEIGILPQAPSISCGSPPQGTVGVPYSHTFPVSGGTSPYVFSISAGSLPPGLTLNSATGSVSGTPTLSGTSGFTVQVTTADHLSDSVSCSIIIAPSSSFPTPIVGGGPPAIMCPKTLTVFDWCMEDLIRRTKRIQFPPLCAMPEGLKWRAPWEDEDEQASPIPAQAVPFRVEGSILTPGPADGDVLVCSGRVPLGYDGILTTLYQVYTGSGFEQGSGDIIWRVRKRQQWLKGLGNQPFSLGSSITPVPLTEGHVLFSGSSFSYFVNVPNLSTMIQVGNSRILCGMLGFYWPRG